MTAKCWINNEAVQLQGSSFIPRPHPLTRRNGLVNKVEFLGLVHIVSPSNVQNILHHTHSKKVPDTRVEIKIFYHFKGSAYVIITKLGISLVLCPFHYLEISPRNSTLFTRPFLARGARYETMHNDCLSYMVRTTYVGSCSTQFIPELSLPAESVRVQHSCTYPSPV